MARKIQVPAIGGIRKVIQPGGTPGTTIAGFEGATISIAQLKTLLGIAATPASGASAAPTAALVPGPGLQGGGALIGAVGLQLTAPIPALMAEDGEDGERGAPGPPGPRGAAGPQGVPGMAATDEYDEPGFAYPTISLGAPKTLVGLAASSGSSAHALRSDAGLAIDQSISPTWTGNHVFGATSGFPLQVTAAPFSGTLTVDFFNNSTATDGNAVRFIVRTQDANGAFYATTSAQSTPIVAGGPTGAQITMRTLGTAPLVFGTSNTYRGQITGGGVWVIAGSAAGTPALELDTQASSGSKTVTILLTDFPGTNAGSKTPKYIPVTLDGSKYWIQALPD